MPWPKGKTRVITWGDKIGDAQRGISCPQRGRKSRNKKTEVGYCTMHYRVRVRRLKTDICSWCHEERFTQWAWNHHLNQSTRWENNMPYSLDIRDYIELCVPCHKKLDKT